MIKIIHSSSPILICAFAIALNLFGAFVARNFNLQLFLDTGGTILIAMMSGYVPGVIVGFVTHFFASFANESEMYYCSVSIFIAIVTTFLARRGWFRSFIKMLLAIPVIALVSAILSEVIGKFLFCTGVVAALNEIQMHFAIKFVQELIDKSLTIIAAFLLLKFVPQSTKDIFRTAGKKQAPLTAEMRNAIYERKCPKSSLRTKMLLILMLSSLFISGSIALISYRIFEQACAEAQAGIANGLATIAASEIDSAKVDDYIRRGRNAEDYNEIERKFRAIKDSNVDIKNLRVEKISKDGGRIIFSTDENFSFGEIAHDKNFFSGDLLLGEEKISNDGDELLMTLYKPILDDAGKIQCYVGIDLSMNLVLDYGRTLTAKVLALFSGCFVFVFVVGLRFVENNIVLPVNTMDYCTRNFVYDSDEFCTQNLEQLKRLKIHTGDEIENLYHALMKTTQDVATYFEKLRRAKKQVAAMDELAHKDSLTGLKNKAAYDEATANIDKKISDGDAEFCIVMIDVNFLKKINDTYGHERGNNYLMNAAKLICLVFGEEHVYRIGGDEFVVVIEGEKISLCKYFVEQFRAEMARKNSNKLLEPWEKISAAAGIAFYSAGVDKSADEVFKRADKEMYENKLAMKANRTD